MASRDFVPHSKISEGLRGATSTHCFIRMTIVLIHQTEYPKIVSFPFEIQDSQFYGKSRTYKNWLLQDE